MSNEDLLSILNEKSMSFTLKELDEMLDEELNKSPDEMDVDLVDECTDILLRETKRIKREQLAKARRIKIGKILAAAAIMMVIISIALPVGARYINSNVSDKIVMFYDNCFNINLLEGQTQAEKYSDPNHKLVKALNEKGIDNVILPALMLTDEFDFGGIELMQNDLGDLIRLKFNNSDLYGGWIYINIINPKHLEDELKMDNQFDTVKQIEVNGLDVIVFSNDENSTITYIDNLTKYDINLENCNYNTAIEIAQSIGD